MMAQGLDGFLPTGSAEWSPSAGVELVIEAGVLCRNLGHADGLDCRFVEILDTSRYAPLRENLEKLRRYEHSMVPAVLGDGHRLPHGRVLIASHVLLELGRSDFHFEALLIYFRYN